MWGDLVERPRLPSRRRHDSPPRGLRLDQLTRIERRIVQRLKQGDASVGQLAWSLGVGRLTIRNGLRRVVRERYAVRVERGVYRSTRPGGQMILAFCA